MLWYSNATDTDLAASGSRRQAARSGLPTVRRGGPGDGDRATVEVRAPPSADGRPGVAGRPGGRGGDRRQGVWPAVAGVLGAKRPKLQGQPADPGDLRHRG